MAVIPIYRIRIAGILEPSWSDWFEGLAITYEEKNVTMLTGPLRDQAALHGVLNKIRDLGLTLIGVAVESGDDEDAEEA